MMKHKRLSVFCVVLLLAKLASAQFFYDTEVKAHDFEGVTVDGQHYRLFDSEAKNILLCFWSVDCDYCHEFMKLLGKNADLVKDYELVTFALADKPRQVRKKVRRWKLQGLHFYDEAGWDSRPFLDYDINTTPTVVLIDKDKNLVGEAYDWDEFLVLIIGENTNIE